MAHIAHASWSLYWDSSRKGWFLCSRSEVGPYRTVRIDSAVPVQDVEVQLISHAIARELMAVLHS